MGAAASVVIAPISAAVGYGLTYIKDKSSVCEILPGNVKKITNIIVTRNAARVSAGILTLGLTELMNHREESVELLFEDEYIGSNEKEAAEKLNEKGNEFYEKGEYETADKYFVAASELAKHNTKYKENLNKTKQKIKEEAERRKRETAERLRGEEAKRQAREAASIYQQAEALSSIESKLEKYELAWSKCKTACESDVSREVFDTLNKIFESCLKYDAHDEAEEVLKIVERYFPSEADHCRDALATQQDVSWSPDYESKVRRKQQEQSRTVVMLLTSSFNL